MISRNFWIRRLPLLTVAAFLYSLLFQLLYNLMRYHTMVPYRDLGEVAVSCGMQFIFIYIMCLGVYGVVFDLFTRQKVWLKTTIDILVCGLMFAALNLFAIHVLHIPIDWGGTAFNAIFILLALEAAYFMECYKISLEKSARIREEVAEYKFEVLKAQVNPHFLFNSLNILSSMVALDSPRTPDFIRALASIYRYILSCEGKSEVALTDELAFFNNYAEILKMRYPGILDIEVSIPASLRKRHIVPFTLQLLLENVTKHNVISEETPMKVVITADDESIRMTNPIHKKKTTTGSRVGVRYLSRFYARHNREFRIERDAETFTAIIPYL